MEAVQLSSTNARSRLMVPESAAVLKRFFFLQREIVLMQAGWIPGTAAWAAKLLLPELLWEDSTILRLLRERVLELRFPERRIVPGEDAELLSDWRAFRNAPDGIAFLAGLRELKRFLRRAYVSYLDVADALNDGPSLRILRSAIADIERQLVAIDNAIGREGAGETIPTARWRDGVRDALAPSDACALLAPTPPRQTFDWSAAGGREFVFARRAARDSQFQRLLFAWPDRLDNSRSPGEGLELQLRVAVHHCNEVWAAEMAAAVLWDFAEEAPHEFIEDAARWCYDEIRHCRMGYSRLLDWGFREGELPLDSFSYDASAEADPLVRLGTIFYFETTYIHTKSERTKIFTRVGDRLSAHDMDFDWADELIHTHYGSRWLKHFLQARAEERSADQIKAQAYQLVRHVQESASAADKAATEQAYRRLLQRAGELAHRRRA